MIIVRPAAILFDMDGLLLDTERLIRDAMIAAMGDLGFAMTGADYAELIGRPEPASQAIMQARFGAELDYDAMRAEVRRRIREEWGPIRPLKPGAAALLAQVNRAGIPAAVVTSSEQALARAHLGHVGLLDGFATIVGCDDVANGKPHPEPYRTAAARLGIAPGAALALEDSHNGIIAAHMAGVPVIMVPDLLPATPDIRPRLLAVADDLHQVGRWLADTR
ncbi:HAD family phosphatase [Sandarakinorhabdus sp. AAP62]|uniref:HAD family hydrolase n=1 Tax=Sandarakinorhabdus sp. AAP62 TaxID=1248916 RepID=UPI00031712B8|nr:HAD family phosphatase [Sandarakinorhabdus sp. AAP62]